MQESYDRELVIKYLSKMHEVAGAKFTWAGCQKDNWFLKHTWTREQEIDFKAWLVGEIRKDLKLPRKRAIKEADMFLLNWGWKNEG